MRIASFLCLLAVAAGATSAAPSARHAAVNGEVIALPGAFDVEYSFASTAFTAMECRVYAHIRDNVVSKLESRKLKGRCNFDELRHRNA